MTVPTVACTNCGKNFTTDDLRGTSCKYCGTLLAHHARAQEQVAVLNRMMADHNGNGIPDAYEGLIANAQANALHQVVRGAPAYGGPPMLGPMGQPMAPQPMMAPVSAVHVQQATRAVSTAFIVVGIVVALAVVLTVGGAVAALLLLR